MRSSGCSIGHSQTCQSDAPSSMEKKMISARPTKFSNGTKPTLARREAAVGRVVPVVAHHEEVAGRHHVDVGVVPVAASPSSSMIVVRHAARQRLAIMRHRLGRGRNRRRSGNPRSAGARRLAVDVEHAVDHLDPVARQADHALDVVGRVVLRQLEDGDVAALRLGGPDAAREEIGAERDRVRE